MKYLIPIVALVLAACGDAGADPTFQQSDVTGAVAPDGSSGDVWIAPDVPLDADPDPDTQPHPDVQPDAPPPDIPPPKDVIELDPDVPQLDVPSDAELDLDVPFPEDAVELDGAELEPDVGSETDAAEPEPDVPCECVYPEVCILGTCVCIPQCQGLECGGFDGCGGTCGTCPGEQTVCIDGSCVCIADCTNKKCGDDGCGGSCGDCDDGDICTGDETCVDFQCVAGIPMDCDDDDDTTKDVCYNPTGCDHQSCVVGDFIYYWSVEKGCQPCLVDEHCDDDFFCSTVLPETNQCMSLDDPCAACTVEEPYCHLAPTGQYVCVECKNDDHCPEDLVCSEWVCSDP
jgi:hypothetical protein